jgi:hypothetical protein
VCDVLVGEAEIVGAILVEERVVDEIHARHRVQVGIATHLHGKERLFVVLRERGEWDSQSKIQNIQSAEWEKGNVTEDSLHLKRPPITVTCDFSIRANVASM